MIKKSFCAALLVTLVFSTGGCILPAAFVKVYPPHPKADQAVEVVAIDGFRPVLSDGRTVELAGMDFSRVDPAMRWYVTHRLEKLLVGFRFVVEPVAGWGLVRLYRVQDETHYEGPGMLLAPNLENLNNDDWPYVAAIVPIFLICVPQEYDPTPYLLNVGLADLQDGDLPETRWAREYRLKADQARQHRKAIWASDSHKLSLLCAAAAPAADIQALLKRGANPDGPGDPETVPPLVGACANNRSDIVELLIQASADVNIRDPESNETPLHALAKEQRPGVVETARLLLQAGADPDLVDVYRRTPSQLAAGAGQDELAELLRTWKPPTGD